MKALLRSPLLHFLLLGAVLFAVQAKRSNDDLASDAADQAAHRITIEADRLAEIRSTFAQQMGRRPEEAEVARMVEAEAIEEILYREALDRGLLERDGGVQTRLIQKMLFLEGESEIEDAQQLLARAVELGLHRDDIVVRRILVQKMKLLASSLTPDQAVTDSDLIAAYQARADELRAPDRVGLAHVFLSTDRRGPNTHRDALALHARLVAESTPAHDAPAEGDPFPLGHLLEGRSQHDLERTFGADFGEAVFDLELESWSAPIASAYGLHLVRLFDREVGEIPPLEVVADRLRLQIEEQRRDANLEALVSDLRARYEVVFATAPDAARATQTAPPSRSPRSSSPLPNLPTEPLQEPG